MRKLTNQDRWRGLIQLTADGVCAVSRQAEDLQLRITRPLPFAWGDALTKGIHRSVRGIASLSGAAVGTVLKHWPIPTLDAKSDHPTKPVHISDNAVSILNGVCGDHLRQSNNPLALQMQLIGLEKAGRKPLALFVHGLCLNDSHWQAHAEAVRSWGYAAIFLRYNSGLAIADNGAELARLLDQHLVSKQSITVIAHSMGGLVTRYALQQAHAKQLNWHQQLQSVFYLGTPHAGAPLEQAGMWVESLWRAIPYAAALAPIARIRSQGIIDLGQGLNEMQLPNDIVRRYQEYLIAATLMQGTRQSTTRAKGMLGDGLVPVASALGHQAIPISRIPKSQQHTFAGIGHIDLLRAPEVMARIKGWLGIE
jgi:pimeloyl-ACP methyl ester carboxylesterase